MSLENFNFSEAVNYHYGKFPPSQLNTQHLIVPLAKSSAALARYDQMLKGLHNSEILLAPLRNQEAVVSSRMEGTVSTLDEVLQYEADQEDGVTNRTSRNEAIEVFLYSRALKLAQQMVEDGQPISKFLLRTTHKNLLGFIGRGADKSPGEFKTEQNYLIDRGQRKVMFVPIRPEHLNDGLDKLFQFIENEDFEPLMKTAIAHLEFEALHPFKDGNGRIGRMIITLMLWKLSAISAPHFYISGSLEKNRDQYIEIMRNVSRTNDWTSWIVFFLAALEDQANSNLDVAEKINALYQEMKERFREVLSSQWSTLALDFLFTKPVFRNNIFTNKSGIPPQTAHRFTRALSEQQLLKTIRPYSGRRAALYAFEPLLEIVRS